MPLNIGSNIAALRAQRRLGEASSQVGSALTRLSSGQRINSASDDASGLAVATSLKARRTVYLQGIRNLNDGVSLIAVAEAGTESLSSILTRQRELATQAATETLSASQRIALNRESDALTTEFNRIVESTQFNGQKLLNGDTSTLTLQGGIGASASLTVSLGSGLLRPIGDGTYQAGVSFSAPDSPVDTVYTDLDGDGKVDALAAGYNVGGAYIMRGLGGGAFAAPTQVIAAGSAAVVGAVDLNGDGNIDIVTAAESTNKLYVSFGNGSGTFGTAVTYATGTSSGIYGLELSDFNGDGSVDAAILGQGTVGILLNNGNGTLSGPVTVAASASTETQFDSADINNDGIVDMVVADGSENTVSYYIGNGNGTFKARQTISIGSYARDVRVGDLNRDGNVDLVVSNAGADTIQVYNGRGDGTFVSGVTYSVAQAGWNTLYDANADGYLDVVTAGFNSTPAEVLLNNGSGGLTAGAQLSLPASMYGKVGAADVNGDGVPDIITAHGSAIDKLVTFVANTRQGATMGLLDISTQAAARESFAIIDAAMERASKELGVLGATQSRLSSWLNTLRSTTENLAVATSRIMDADVAEESANLTAAVIRQQAAAAILAQANQAPALVMTLLQPR
jgi:flagellin